MADRKQGAWLQLADLSCAYTISIPAPCARLAGAWWTARAAVFRNEHDAGVTHKIAAPKGRYVTDQWKHGPDWAFYGEGGEDWFGFKGVRALGDHEPNILMIPLPGHTLGHCGIAVRGKDKWLLHAGDSYLFHRQMH